MMDLTTLEGKDTPRKIAFLSDEIDMVINSRRQLGKICELVESGLKQGTKLLQSRCRLPKGYWYPPSFFTGVTASRRIAREEIFGPVLSVMTFRTAEEAIESANDTLYG